jgi:hypothetical protein
VGERVVVFSFQFSVFSFQFSVFSGTTLRVVVVLLAEMREQPGGSEYHVAMPQAKGTV